MVDVRDKVVLFNDNSIYLDTFDLIPFAFTETVIFFHNFLSSQETPQPQGTYVMQNPSMISPEIVNKRIRIDKNNGFC